MQVERMLAAQGFGGRRECRALVLRGRFELAGEVCDDPGLEIDAVDGLAFAVDGEAWTYRERSYIALHKPVGYECSHKPSHYPSVYTLLPRPLLMRGLQAVGRLDTDTTGLLLLTDDGQFIHTYSSPKKKVPKVYEAIVKHPLEPALCEALLAGVQLNDEPEPIAAKACAILDPHRLEMTVTEGKYHLVKRMIAAAGNRVEELHRREIGGYCLPTDLPLGEWRYLEAADLAALAAGRGA